MNASAVIHKLPAPKGAVRHKPRKATRGLRKHAPAAGLGAVIVVLLGLSLTHLSTGVQIVTHCAWWEALAMAIGLDLLIVGLEVAMVVTAGTRAYKPGRPRPPTWIWWSAADEH